MISGRAGFRLQNKAFLQFCVGMYAQANTGDSKETSSTHHL